MNNLKMGNSEIKKLCEILLQERKAFNWAERGAKLNFVLRLLGAGTTLSIWFQKTTQMTRSFDILEDGKNEWKAFNDRYLKNTIKYLERRKLVEIKIRRSRGTVVLTEDGKRRVLENAVSEMVIGKPARWDHKWRIVMYDIHYDRKGLRDHFQKILKNAGFFQLQESVYVHAYPCEKEIEFMRNFLGLGGEVRLVVADFIENEKQFREYFDV